MMLARGEQGAPHRDDSTDLDVMWGRHVK